jgi:uncharacterized protein YjlB
MGKKATEYSVEHYFVKEDGLYPNSELPVLFYRNALRLPRFLKASYVKRLFRRHNWSNAWEYGIFEYHHYHSITHEVLGVIKGDTRMMLGGPKGIVLHLKKGDVLIIPAGVAHKNMGRQDQITCIGAYPGGHDYDINYGTVGERPRADRNISKVPKPTQDPVFGRKGGLLKYW